MANNIYSFSRVQIDFELQSHDGNSASVIAIARWDSYPRPSAYRSTALPSELQSQDGNSA